MNVVFRTQAQIRFDNLFRVTLSRRIVRVAKHDRLHRDTLLFGFDEGGFMVTDAREAGNLVTFHGDTEWDNSTTFVSIFPSHKIPRQNSPSPIPKIPQEPHIERHPNQHRLPHFRQTKTRRVDDTRHPIHDRDMLRLHFLPRVEIRRDEPREGLAKFHGPRRSVIVSEHYAPCE